MKKKVPVVPEQRCVNCRETYWKKLFNNWANYTDSHSMSGWSRNGLRQRMEAYFDALKKCKLDKGGLVLDLGCGPGDYSRLLKESGYQVYGADFAWKQVAKANLISPGRRIDYLSADALALPFKDNVYDHLLCVGLFQSIDNHRKVLDEICRVMKKGGLFIVITLNAMNIKVMADNLIKKDLLLINNKYCSRLLRYNPSAFSRDVMRAGFVDVTYFPVQIMPDWPLFQRGVKKIWNKIPFFRDISAQSFLITARKS